MTFSIVARSGDAYGVDRQLGVVALDMERAWLDNRVLQALREANA
ncbi:MAG TPA: hypothetical protein VFF32_05680 [Dermatophilaceae bacterium]|nr:hypothetical protein [Dermatophilaceae bacterium]